MPKPPLLGEVASSVSEDDGEVLQRFREIPETDKIPETPANSTGTVILIYPTRVCFARVSRRKFRFCVHLDSCMDKAKFGKMMPVKGPGGQAEKISAPPPNDTFCIPDCVG